MNLQKKRVKKEEKEYIDIDQLLTIQCPKGHEFGMSFRDFKSGKRCPTCENIKNCEHCYKLDKLLNKHKIK